MRIDFKNLEVVVEDAYLLSPEEFTNIRRQGIGASDASVILGLQSKWKTSEDIIKEKLQRSISAEEIEVGNKPSVRKGRDLEHIVLNKAEDWLHCEVDKPTDMYRFKDSPWLTVNFDGITTDPIGTFTVVEAKVVTQYGEKFYDRDKALKSKSEIEFVSLIRNKKAFLKQDIETKAKACGIPPYYYAQVQQQLLAIDAPYGYLAALHDKDWELKMYLVPADPEVQAKIITESKKIWNIIEEARR